MQDPELEAQLDAEYAAATTREERNAVLHRWAWYVEEDDEPEIVLVPADVDPALVAKQAEAIMGLKKGSLDASLLSRASAFVRPSGQRQWFVVPVRRRVNLPYQHQRPPRSHSCVRRRPRSRPRLGRGPPRSDGEDDPHQRYAGRLARFSQSSDSGVNAPACGAYGVAA